MATLLKTDGRVLEIKPLNGPEFSLEELKRIVGGFVEILQLEEPGKLLIINEEGDIENLPFNGLATEMYKHDRIVGDAVVVDRSEIS
jgi:hypothetical protein